jgi:hypothetical protein
MALNVLSNHGFLEVPSGGATHHGNFEGEQLQDIVHSGPGLGEFNGDIGFRDAIPVGVGATHPSGDVVPAEEGLFLNGLTHFAVSNERNLH